MAKLDVGNIPYTPSSTVEPTGAIPKIGVQTSADMFGGNVAQAVEGLGSTMGKVGDEMWSRAMAMQELKNQTDARNATTQMILQTGEADAKFSSLRGMDAANGYDTYRQNLQQIREQNGQGLNPMAKKLYDADTQTTMARTIIGGARHAGEQLKKASADAAADREDAAVQSVLSSDDPRAFKEGMSVVEREKNTQLDLAGMKDPQARANEIFKSKSRIFLANVQRMAKTDPPAAAKFLQDNLHAFHSDDLIKAQSAVDTKMHTTGARITSDAVTKGFAPNIDQNQADKVTGVQGPLQQVLKLGTRNAYMDDFNVGIGTPGKVLDPNGRTIELVPEDKSPEAIAKLDTYMEAASIKLGIPIESDGKGHYSLPKDYNVASAPDEIEPTLNEKLALGAKQADREAAGDQTYGDYVKQRIIADHRQMVVDRRDQQYNDTQTVAEAMMTPDAQGNKPRTPEEIMNSSPAAAAAWLNLPSEVRREKTKQMNAEVVREDNARIRADLVGISINDPEKFSFMDISSVQGLTDSTKAELMKYQKTIREKKIREETVPKAIQILREAQIITPEFNHTNDPDRFNVFTGFLRDAINEFSTMEPGKMPKTEDIEEMGRKLMQHQEFSLLDRKTWFDASTPLWERPVPPGEAAKIRAQVGKPMTDLQVQRYFVRSMYHIAHEVGGE